MTHIKIDFYNKNSDKYIYISDVLENLIIDKSNLNYYLYGNKRILRRKALMIIEYFNNQNSTYKSISKKHNISISRVRSIIQEVLRILKKEYDRNKEEIQNV